MSSEYINNKDFEKLIKNYLKNKNNEELKNEVTICLYLLSDNIIKAFNFQLISKEDALQEGVYTCLKQMHLFNSQRGKAFNWFTTIILNHYRQLYRSERNYGELKKRLLEKELENAPKKTDASKHGISYDYVKYRNTRDSYEDM